MHTPLAIDIQSLSFSYNANYEHYVFENINLSVKEGEILLLQGSSGSGKTTLLKIIGGLGIENSMISGDVLYNGFMNSEKIPINSPSFINKIRNKYVSLIFQNSNSAFLEEMTVFDQLKPALKNRMAISESILYENFSHYILEYGFLENDNILLRRPNQLSGGQLQRIDIAFAIFSGSKILLMDEPLTALDEDNYNLIIKKLLSFSRGGGIIILASHDLSLEEKLLARTSVLEREVFSSFMLENVSISDLIDLNTSSNSLHLKSSISKSYSNSTSQSNQGDKPVLRNIELELNDQISMVGIVGESGAGKTTLLKILAGIITPDKGSSIEFSRSDRNIEMIFQASPQSLNPSFSLENILKNTRQEKNVNLQRLLAIFQLDNSLLNRTPGQLSGGQIQRFCLLKALLNQPDLLLMDEPMVGLDERNKKIIIDVLKYIKLQTNIKVIIVSHQIEGLKTLFDRIIHVT